MEQLKQQELEKDKDYTMSQNYPYLTKKKKGENLLSAIAECPVQNKKMTSQDKLHLCDNNSAKQILCKTSEVDSTSKGKDCKPFYNEYCKEISSHLLSHTEIDCAGSDLNLSNSCSNKTEEKSWFSTKKMFHHNKNSQKICLPYCMSSRAECTDLENTKIKSKKIRIYPNQKQKQLFKQWFGISRLFYNKTVDFYNDKEHEKLGWMGIAKQLTDTLIMDYVKAVPYQIKKIAVKDCSTALIVNCKKTKTSGKPFSLRFKSRKNPSQSCYIPKSAVKESGIYYTIAGKLNYSEREWVDKEIQDCRLSYDNGRWYINIPIKEKVVMRDVENQDDVIALDPGIRTFMTYFSLNGHFGWFGYHSFNRLQSLSFKMDKLLSQLSIEKDKKRKIRLRRSINRNRWKIHDLVDELHWNVITYLTSHYKVIILPTFEVSGMVCKWHRKLHSKSVRNMLNYRYYEFGERLKMKCAEHGILLIRSNEAYTSKTNSFSGELIPKLGSKESFMYDGIVVHRDINGARNVLLRAMRDSSASS